MSLTILKVVLGRGHAIDNGLLVQLLEVPGVVRVIIGFWIVGQPARADLSGSFDSLLLVWLAEGKVVSRQSPCAWLGLADVVLDDEIIFFAAEKDLLCLTDHFILFQL